MASINKPNPPADKQDCQKKWEEELRKAKNALVKKHAELVMAEQIYKNSVIWEGKLKTYCDNIKKTEEATKKIDAELGIFITRLDEVCGNTKCLVEVLMILFCLLKIFYKCTDDLKETLSELKREIECLNNPELNPKSSIVVGCIEELCVKIDAAIESQNDVIKKMVEILKCASELYEMICGKECSLHTLISYLNCLFDGTLDSESSDDDCPSSSCDASISPKPSMPLSKDDYRKSTCNQYDESKTEKNTAKSAYDNIRKEYIKLLAIKSGLVDAIEASEAAKACK